MYAKKKDVVGEPNGENPIDIFRIRAELLRYFELLTLHLVNFMRIMLIFF